MRALLRAVRLAAAPRCRRGALGALTLIVLAPVLATGAAAQGLSIEGTVAAAGTGEPLAGAVVYLLDSELQGVRAVLSDGDGAFRLAAPGPGRYSLEVERIGFETSLFPPFEVPGGGIRNLSLGVQVRPIEIEGISVTAETVCDIAGGGGDLVGVWTEARKALTATVLSEGQSNLLFTLEVSQRRLNARDLLLHEEVDTLLTDWNSAFAFVPVADLGDAGWGRLDGPALAEVFGPSPQILLSPWFTDNHCLGVAPPSPDSLVGLAFTSKEGVFDVGIEGAFWFETPSWLLRRISFRFSGPLGLENASGQGGEIVLSVGSEGSWYVHSWRILVPTWIARPGGLFGWRTGAAGHGLHGVRRAGDRAIAGAVM